MNKKQIDLPVIIILSLVIYRASLVQSRYKEIIRTYHCRELSASACLGHFV
jgi:hypothetical protein